MRLDPAQDFVAFHGRARARIGDRVQAERAIEELRVMGRSGRNAAFFCAEVLVALGETRAALNELDKAITDYPQLAATLAVYPYWDELRSEPRFQELVKDFAWRR